MYLQTIVTLKNNCRERNSPSKDGSWEVTLKVERGCCGLTCCYSTSRTGKVNFNSAVCYFNTSVQHISCYSILDSCRYFPVSSFISDRVNTYMVSMEMGNEDLRQSTRSD